MSGAENLTRGRACEAQIARLRKKIELNKTAPALIKSVRGVGYVFTGRPPLNAP